MPLIGKAELGLPPTQHLLRQKCTSWTTTSI